MEEKEQEENKSLKDDILGMIQTLLDHPKMFANNVEALEGQFFNLVTLVAPYAFEQSQREAGEKIFAYISLATENGLSQHTEDIDVAGGILKQLYVQNFECYTRVDTLH